MGVAMIGVGLAGLAPGACSAGLRHERARLDRAADKFRRLAAA